MKKNVGSIDRIIRLIAAAIIVILYFTHMINGTLGIVLLVIAGVLVLTSFVGLCPLYMALGINTDKKV